jgi:hypothetical protein
MIKFYLFPYDDLDYMFLFFNYREIYTNIFKVIKAIVQYKYTKRWTTYPLAIGIVVCDKWKWKLIVI